MDLWKKICHSFNLNALFEESAEHKKTRLEIEGMLAFNRSWSQAIYNDMDPKQKKMMDDYDQELADIRKNSRKNTAGKILFGRALSS